MAGSHSPFFTPPLILPHAYPQGGLVCMSICWQLVSWAYIVNGHPLRIRNVARFSADELIELFGWNCDLSLSLYNLV